MKQTKLTKELREKVVRLFLDDNSSTEGLAELTISLIAKEILKVLPEEKRDDYSGTARTSKQLVANLEKFAVNMYRNEGFNQALHQVKENIEELIENTKKD